MLEIVVENCIRRLSGTPNVTHGTSYYHEKALMQRNFKSASFDLGSFGPPEFVTYSLGIGHVGIPLSLSPPRVLAIEGGPRGSVSPSDSLQLH